MTKMIKMMAVALATITLASAAQAATLYTANNGVDSDTCGTTAAQACRSISKAIAKAVAGDTVEVGPGSYGDIDGDGAYTTDGEEHWAAGDYIHDSLILIDKAITVVSRDGAGETAIRLGNDDPDGGDPHLPNHVVEITGDGAVFGQKNKGFTIVGLPGVYSGDIDLFQGIHATEDTENVTIAGNIVTNFFWGMFVGGQNSVVEDNIVSLNRSGIVLEGSGHSIRYNVVNANGGGIENEFGDHFEINHNMIVGNESRGILLDGTDHTVTNNSILGNNEAGIYLFGTAGIHENNIYGNGAYGVQGLKNCGIMLADLSLKLSATNNYWGSVTGPGPNPADRICPGGKIGIISTPFATKAFNEPVRTVR